MDADVGCVSDLEGGFEGGIFLISKGCFKQVKFC